MQSVKYLINTIRCNTQYAPKTCKQYCKDSDLISAGKGTFQFIHSDGMTDDGLNKAKHVAKVSINQIWLLTTRCV